MAKSRRRSSRRNRRRSHRMRGGACSLALSPGPFNGPSTMPPATEQSLAQGAQFGGMTRSYHGGFRSGGTAYGVNLPMGGGRRRRSRRRMRGGMAPLGSAFGPAGNGAGVARDMAHLGGQDAAFAEAAAFSKTPAGTDNPGLSQAGGRRRRRSRRGRKMRGGALLEGAPYSQTSSDMLLEGAQAAAAAKMMSPDWTGVATPRMIAAGYPAVPGL